MARFSRLGGLPAFVLLLGCAPKLNIASLPTKPFPTKVDRIYAIYTVPASGSGLLMTQLKEALDIQFKDRGMTSKGWVKNYLDLNEKAKLESELSQFQPRHILSVAQTSTTYTEGFGFPSDRDLPKGATLDLNLVEVATQEVVWKARLSYEGSNPVQAPLMGARILEALIADGVVAAPSPAK